MGIRYASGDCEGPGSATQSSWTREDETLWADTSLPEIPRGQSRGGGSFIPHLNLGSYCSNMQRESWIREGKKYCFSSEGETEDQLYSGNCLWTHRCQRMKINI